MVLDRDAPHDGMLKMKKTMEELRWVRLGWRVAAVECIVESQEQRRCAQRTRTTMPMAAAVAVAAAGQATAVGVCLGVD